MSKKSVRKNIWKRKGYRAAIKAFSFTKSVSIGRSKRFFLCVSNIKLWNNLNRYEAMNYMIYKMNDSH